MDETSVDILRIFDDYETKYEELEMVCLADFATKLHIKL